jgi:hypothetical protein
MNSEKSLRRFSMSKDGGRLCGLLKNIAAGKAWNSRKTTGGRGRHYD